ncbi:glycosyl transferase [Intrasporangium oryzae NRRL B-24470]|uniref:Glycosyl transferase n=1 Tax=Intrasporangium oryzae NRRL B-24470 TaxID=1386089 RepID=W9G2X1_9MICO|nr:glycosyltransferase family 2 protein [Intrasporangium oryzae]EWT00466.1 glycosyl transferase [Intrasporangium oryzae NRRL B-24470]
MNLSVIIPCYRSRQTLPELVERLQVELPKIAEAYEVILVVDGSPDDTYAVARSLELRFPATVRALLLRRNYGQHNALLAGLARAKYEFTVTMDDDLQHRPEELATLIAPLSDPLVDLVYGVAVEEEHGVFRSLASRMVKAALSAADVPSARDVSAFRAFRTDLRDGFAHVADPFASIDVLLSWTTNSIRRVEITMDHRTVGTSSYTFSSLARHAMNMVTGYGTVPLKLVTWLGFGCSLLGFALLVFVLVRFIAGDIAVAGFTTLASMLAILSGAMMLSIGILGEYIGRLHFRSMQRPTFLVRVDGGEGGPRAGIPGTELEAVVEEKHPDEIAAALSARYAGGPAPAAPGEPRDPAPALDANQADGVTPSPESLAVHREG